VRRPPDEETTTEPEMLKPPEEVLPEPEVKPKRMEPELKPEWEKKLEMMKREMMREMDVSPVTPQHHSKLFGPGRRVGTRWARLQ
jgi:hypothetical protein